MSGSTTEQQGWFHRWTGTPFGQAVGWQKPIDPVALNKIKLQSELQEALKDKDTISKQIDEVGQQKTKYQQQISETKVKRVQNVFGSLGRLSALGIDGDWVYGDPDPTDSSYDSLKQFNKDREELKQTQRIAEKNLVDSQKNLKNLNEQLVKVQTTINQKTVMLENPVQNNGLVKTS